MTQIERRGKWLFLILASLIVLEKLSNVGLSFSNGIAQIKWLKSVIQRIGFTVAVAFLWQGETWLRWLVGLAYIFSGGLLAFVSGRVLVNLANVTQL